MHFIAWNGQRWSAPFQPNELVEDSTGGLRDRDGTSIAWDDDGYRGENWLAMKDWTEERAREIEQREEGDVF